MTFPKYGIQYGRRKTGNSKFFYKCFILAGVTSLVCHVGIKFQRLPPIPHFWDTALQWFLLATLWDETGSQKSNMAAAKPEVLAYSYCYYYHLFVKQ